MGSQNYELILYKLLILFMKSFKKCMIYINISHSRVLIFVLHWLLVVIVLILHHLSKHQYQSNDINGGSKLLEWPDYLQPSLFPNVAPSIRFINGGSRVEIPLHLEKYLCFTQQQRHHKNYTVGYSC